MPRIRFIKPEFFDDPDIGALTPLAALMFIGLWTQADREGRLIVDARRLKTRLAPYWPCNFTDILNELAAAGFIHFYEDAQSRKLLQIRSFSKHQRPHPKEAPSLLNAPDVKINNEPCNLTASKPDSGFLILDSGIRILDSGKLLAPLGNPSDQGVQKNVSGTSYIPAKKAKKPLVPLADFERFYECYPRHIGKQAALKAWTRLQPDAALCATIMAAVEQQTPHWTDPQYIPHPATWLNQGRWNDEILPPSPFGHSKVAHGNAIALKQALDEHYAAQNTIQHEDTTHDRDGFPAIRRRIDDSR